MPAARSVLAAWASSADLAGVGAQFVEGRGCIGLEDGERGGVGLEFVAGQGRRSAAISVIARALLIVK